MKVITVTREYGAGGGEVARQLAATLGWQLLDRELLHRAAEIEHVPDTELEQLDEKALKMADRFRLHPPHQKYLHGLTEAARRAAQKGEVVLVGRGARHLLGEMPGAFHLRLVAPQEWRTERMSRLEGWSLDEARTRCIEVERVRGLFTRYFFGQAATQPAQYDLTVNTARVPLEDVTGTVTTMVRSGSAPAVGSPTGRRVLTLSRERGAGDAGFAPPLADRLKLHVFDRELLEQESAGSGLSEAQLEKIDEQPASIFQRFRPGSIYQRYFEALKETMRKLADRGDVILVGRGGNCFLRDDPRAFHVRLVAPIEVRCRRIMEYRWVREAVAKKQVAESDTQRRRYHECYFGIDWSNPLEYHITVNSGRLGPMALELVAVAAERHWSRS
jgi:cytidylate kinase